MRIAVCDDDRAVFEQIRGWTGAYYTEYSLLAQARYLYFSDGLRLLQYVEKESVPDLVFLDIEMMFSNGMDVARQLRERFADVIIIFVSSHREYVFDAFRCEALHFLVKPIDRTDFDDCFARAMHKYTVTHSTLPLKWKFERANIAVKDVLYVEAYRGHLIVHTVQGTEDVIGKLKDMFAFLQPHGFLRIHHGYIVNMQHIRRFNSDSVTLCNGEDVQMSVRKRNDALQVYDRFLQKRKW